MRMSSNTEEKVSCFIVIKAGLVHHSTVGFHCVNHDPTAARSHFFKASPFRKVLLADETRHCKGVELFDPNVSAAKHQECSKMQTNTHTQTYI